MKSNDCVIKINEKKKESYNHVVVMDERKKEKSKNKR